MKPKVIELAIMEKLQAIKETQLEESRINMWILSTDRGHLKSHRLAMSMHDHYLNIKILIPELEKFSLAL